ncbi:MAG: type II toxin-antitoxin system PemK/MazF family toxin [Armatimonadetes bacterium]|nr:type II toxin-antitoxin system PemK/MazF family toxin [Armatimonadota bacterium]
MARGISRGDVVRVRLSPAEGSEQGGERPAVVLSPDFINERSPVVIVAAVTSRKTDRVFPFEAAIEPPDGGLSIRSKVMLMQLRSVDKSRIVGRYGNLSQETMSRVEESLKIATGLTRI